MESSHRFQSALLFSLDTLLHTERVSANTVQKVGPIAEQRQVLELGKLQSNFSWTSLEGAKSNLAVAAAF